MRKILCLSVALALFGCSEKEEKHVNATPEMVAAANPPKYVAPPAPVKPPHYYSLEEDGEYGYERGLSENDQKDGNKAKALLMVRYLGQSSGTYSIQLGDNGVKNIASCKAPCEFVKSKTYVSGNLANTETVRAAEGSVIWAVIQDAQNGELTPYGKHKR